MTGEESACERKVIILSSLVMINLCSYFSITSCDTCVLYGVRKYGWLPSSQDLIFRNLEIETDAFDYVNL